MIFKNKLLGLILLLLSSTCIQSQENSVDNSSSVQGCGLKFYQDPLTQECSPCTSNCIFCDNPLTCKTCDQGFIISLVGACVPSGIAICSSSCQRCSTNGECLACKDTFFLDPTTLQCVSCSPGCQICQDSSTCDECQLGFSRTEDGTCLVQTFAQVCPDNCLQCLDDGTCQQCQSGSMLDAVENLCIKCIDNCAKCVDTSTCHKCNDGFELSSDGTSCIDKSCSIENCYDCNGSICNQCLDGYFADAEGTTCTKCGVGCRQCYDSNVCLACEADLVLTLGKKCIDLFASSQPNVLRCPANCASCNIETSQCLLCNEGYQLTNGQCEIIPSLVCISNCFDCRQGVCYECEDGFFLGSETECVPCMGNCNICEDTFSCLGCADGFYLTQQGECLPCDLSCAACFQTPTQCTACAPGLKLVDTECLNAVSDCPDIFCRECDAADTNYCLDCEEGSYLNSTTGSCLQCFDGFGFADNTTDCILLSPGELVNCEPGQYPTLDGCVDCSFECLECTGPNNCTKCTQGYFNQNGSCVMGIVASTLPITAPTPLCGVNCVSCTLSGTCVLCAEGSFLSEANTCESCPSSCATCSNPTICDTCFDGTIPINGNCDIVSSNPVTVVACDFFNTRRTL